MTIRISCACWWHCRGARDGRGPLRTPIVTHRVLDIEKGDSVGGETDRIPFEGNRWSIADFHKTRSGVRFQLERAQDPIRYGYRDRRVLIPDIQSIRRL